MRCVVLREEVARVSPSDIKKKRHTAFEGSESAYACACVRCVVLRERVAQGVTARHEK